MTPEDALKWSIKGNAPQYIKKAIERGADINDNNYDYYYGRNALIKAAHTGELEVVKTLIENGADVNAQSRHGITALMYAASEGNFDIIKYLVEHGADVNIKSEDGETAIKSAMSNFYKFFERKPRSLQLRG